MASEFLMPQLGLTMTEGTVNQWFKAVGETVAIGDLLVEVETDKITNQLESTFEGVLLEILVSEGTVAPVQAALAVIGQPGEKVERASQVTAATEVAPQAMASAILAAAQTTMKTGERVKASPLAKKIARDHEVDLALVTGTGPNGRVIQRDVLGFIERNQDKTAVVVPSAPALTKVVAPAAKVKEGGVPIAGIRKAISERMSQSWHTAPHVNMTMEVDMTGANELRRKLVEVAGMKYSFTEIITKCVAQALSEFKSVNVSLIDGYIYQHETVNVGMAVALDNGLIVPVIKNANQKNMGVLREDIRALATKAREGNLLPDEITGGNFTISNLGMYDVDQFTQIINPPESAILGVCRTADRAVVRDGEIVIRPIMNLCLTYDHRVIDGAVAAQFLGRVRQLLEQPLLLL